MKPRSFILYTDLLSVLDELNDGQAGKLFKAIKAYHTRELEEVSQDGDELLESLLSDFVTRIAFQPFRAAFERDRQKYESIVERNRINGSKGGRKSLKTQKNPKNPVGYLGTQTNPEEPKQTHNDNGNDNDNDNDIPSPDGEGIDKLSVTQPCLFTEKQLKKPKASKNPPPPFPTLEDIMEYFKSQGAEHRITGWEDSARRFFDNFNAVDWRDKFNRRITRWDSRANSWIFDEEKRQKEQIRDETKHTDRFSERRGTEPGSKSRKGFKGSF